MSKDDLFFRIAFIGLFVLDDFCPNREFVTMKLKKRKQTAENPSKPNKKRKPIYEIQTFLQQKDIVCSQAVSFNNLKNIESSLESMFQAPVRNWGKSTDCTLNADELLNARKQHCSLLFGEILPSGVERLCEPDLLNIRQATRVIDLGCGLGKLVVQLFFSCTHLETVWGVELSRTRFEHLRRILYNFCRWNSARLSFVALSKDSFEVQEGSRQLQIHCGNMFDRHLQRQIFRKNFQVIICETEIPQQRAFGFIRMLELLCDRPGVRLLTYTNLEHLHNTLWDQYKRRCLPFKCLEKIYKDDTEKRLIKTSWSKGHLFDIWVAK
jgi:hypothetical protein